MTYDVYAVNKGHKSKDNDLINKAKMTDCAYALNKGNKSKDNDLIKRPK